MSFTRIGYGQIEPNQLSAQKTGQIYASLALDKDVKVLQNGVFMYYDYAANKVSADDSTAIAEPMLVYNEVKIYEDRLTYKDFAMIRVGDNYVTNGLYTEAYGDGALNEGVNADPAHTEYGYRMDGFAPRLFKTNIGDIYTTNMVKTGVKYNVGDLLAPKKNEDSKTLVLEAITDAAAERMVWAVVKVYTMPDGQPGLKLQRVK